ncbi:MAG: hypothetical protein NVS2B7_31130 [Herpetosiphon sp.]
MQQRRIIGLAFLAALLLTSFFGVRVLHHRSRFATGVDEPIRPWMNVPYVAHSYHVPVPVLLDALGLQPHPPDRRPIRVIARQQGRSEDEIMTTLQHAIDEFRKHPAPPRAPQPPGRSPGAPGRP